MPDKPLTPKEILEKLEPLYAAAIASEKLNQRVCDAVETELGRIAVDHYPGMKNWEPEHLRKLADIISQHACEFCIQVSDVDYEAGRPR